MISKDQIETAKHANLPSILDKIGVNIIAEGNSFYLHEHDSLKFFKKEGIWLYKWWSRGEVGDGIQYLMKHCGKNFREAVELLSGHIGMARSNQSERLKFWMNKSIKLVRIAERNLFAQEGKKRRSYLIHERGFNEKTIQKYHIGWLCENKQMASRIVIPNYNKKGELIRIKFRIDHPMTSHGRYRIMKGSNTTIPFSSNILINQPVIIVESELDAILIAQESGSNIGVIALGGVCTKLSIPIISYLNEKIPINLISLDNDKAGQISTSNLMKKLKNAYNWPIPEGYGKDPGEAYKKLEIKNWIFEGLKKGGYYRSRDNKKSGRVK